MQGIGSEEVIPRYIDGFYNPVGRHSKMDYFSLTQFERLAGKLPDRSAQKQSKTS